MKKPNDNGRDVLPHIKRDVLPVLPKLYRMLAEEAEKAGLVILE